MNPKSCRGTYVAKCKCGRKAVRHKGTCKRCGNMRDKKELVKLKIQRSLYIDKLHSVEERIRELEN